MLPTSDSLEALLERAKGLVADLKRLKSAELKAPATKTALAEIAREWLRLSQSLQGSGVCDGDRLNGYDTSMKDLLAAVGTRARASALRKKLQPLVDGALKDVVVPVIQHEGS